MKCKNCGAKIKDDFDFCPNCGTKIIKELICPNCGTTNELDASFCKKCGTRLVEQAKQPEITSPEKEEIREETHNKEQSFILKIIAMACSVSCVFLLFAFLFIPCLSDRFVPCFEYTMLSYIINGFKDSSLLTHSYSVSLSAVFLSFFSLVFLGLLVITIVSIFKLIKSIQKKQYFDFTKLLALSFSLFLFLFTFFVRFFITSATEFTDSISVWVILLIIFVGLTLSFNLFLALRDKKRLNLANSILIECCFLLLFAALCVSTLFIGGNKFGLAITSKEMTSRNVVGDFDFISNLMVFQNVMNQFTIDYVTKTIVFLGLSFLSELISLCLFALLISRMLMLKKRKIVLPVITFALITILFISSTVFDAVAAHAIAQIDSINEYGVYITCSHIFDESIAKIIITFVLACPLCTLWIILSRKGINENE